MNVILPFTMFNSVALFFYIFTQCTHICTFSIFWNLRRKVYKTVLNWCSESFHQPRVKQYQCVFFLSRYVEVFHIHTSSVTRIGDELCFLFVFLRRTSGFSRSLVYNENRVARIRQCCKNISSHTSVLRLSRLIEKVDFLDHFYEEPG